MRPIHFAVKGKSVPMLNTLIDLGADIDAKALDKAWNPRENGFKKPIQLADRPEAQATLALAGADLTGLAEHKQKEINSAIRDLCAREYARAFLAGMQQAGPQQSGKKVRVKTLKQIGAMSPAKALVPFFARLPGLCKVVGGLLVRFYNRGILCITQHPPHLLRTPFTPHLSPRPL